MELYGTINPSIRIQPVCLYFQGKLKPIPPPLPLPSHVKGEVMPSPSAMSPRKAILKRSVDDGMERYVHTHTKITNIG